MSNITVPLEPALSSSMAVHLQVIRYMIALYAPKLHKSLDCPESFVQHLKMATKISNDAYSWTKEDRAYYKKVSFRPVEFEKFTKVLDKVKKPISNNPLYSVRFCSKIVRAKHQPFSCTRRSTRNSSEFYTLAAHLYTTSNFPSIKQHLVTG